MAVHRSVDSARFTSSQMALYDEVERLLAVLRYRSNRDRLNDQQFFLAGSLLERWKWNSRVISDADLREFAATARELVSVIEAVAREKDQLDT